VALLHGTPTTVDALEPLARALEGRHRVLVVHLPGYGKSPPLDGRYDLARARAAVEDALLGLGAVDAALVGFSGGAYRALDLALGGRLRPARVVSLAGFAALDEAEQAGFRQFAAALRSGVDLHAIAPQRFLSPAFAASHPDACAAVTAWLDATAPELLAQELDAFAEAPSLLPRLGALRAPLLARVGQLDVAVPPAKSEALGRAVPGALVEVVPEFGHALLLEDAEGTVASVSSFLAG
jgi:3-oxoadipate enol-lactonase